MDGSFQSPPAPFVNVNVFDSNYLRAAIPWARLTEIETACPLWVISGSAKRHVRFALNSDRESGVPQTVMSASPPRADMCGANRHICFGPKADISAVQRHISFTPAFLTACGSRRASRAVQAVCP